MTTEPSVWPCSTTAHIRDRSTCLRRLGRDPHIPPHLVPPPLLLELVPEDGWTTLCEPMAVDRSDCRGVETTCEVRLAVMLSCSRPQTSSSRQLARVDNDLQRLIQPVSYAFRLSTPKRNALFSIRLRLQLVPISQCSIISCLVSSARHFMFFVQVCVAFDTSCTRCTPLLDSPTLAGSVFSESCTIYLCSRLFYACVAFAHVRSTVCRHRSV